MSTDDGTIETPEEAPQESEILKEDLKDMPPDRTQARYDAGDLRDLILRAGQIDDENFRVGGGKYDVFGTFSHEELEETAKEAGVTLGALEMALQEADRTTFQRYKANAADAMATAKDGLLSVVKYSVQSSLAYPTMARRHLEIGQRLRAAASVLYPGAATVLLFLQDPKLAAVPIVTNTLSFAYEVLVKGPG